MIDSAFRPATPRRHDHEWSWANALATARPGTRYRVTRLLFSLVRDRCHDLGCQEGDYLTCLENGGRRLLLRRSDGRTVELEREYAWFVEIEPEGIGEGASIQ